MALHVGIDGNEVKIKANSAKVSATIDQRNTTEFVVIDEFGANHYQPGQQVTIVDDTLGTVFAGFIDNDDEQVLIPNSTILHTVQCIGNHYHADKRHYHGPEFNNRLAGDIITDFIEKVLAEESVTANYARDHISTQADFAGGTHNNTVANPDQGGSLALSLAGGQELISFKTTSDFSAGTLTNATATNNSLMPTSTPAIKIQGTQSLAGGGNSYTYIKIWQGNYVVPASANNPHFLYDLWVDPSSPEIKIGVDLVFSDGTTLKDTDTQYYYDAQNMPPHPATDLNGLANTGQWYHRDFYLGSNWSGKTIVQVLVGIEGDTKGVYTGWIKNIQIVSTGPTYQYFFNGTLNIAQQMQNAGYSNTTVSVVNTYAIPLYTPLHEGGGITNGSALVSNAISVDAVKILASSFLSYQATVPTGTLFICKYSLDGNVYYPCTNNAPLPNAIAGMSLAGKSIYFSFNFFLDPSANPLASPEVAPVLSSVQCSLNPSYSATKSDALFFCGAQADWTQTGATLTNTAANSRILTLNGYTRNWDDGNANGQDLYGVANSIQGPNDRAYQITCAPSGDARSRMTFCGQWQNFICELDILVTANAAGIVYRTTGWSNTNNTYGYTVTLSTTQLLFGHGTNSASGTGGFSQISSVTLSLTSGNWHHLKVICNGTTHQVFIDDISYLNVTDSTYTAAGYIGLRVYNGTTSTVSCNFDNFGVVAALSGTWVSPSVSLAAASAYGNSLLSYRNQCQDNTNCSIKVESSLNGGSTWTAYTNAAQGTSANPLQGLASNQSLTGVSILFRVTLTTTTASSLPGIDNFRMLVLGYYSASGTRVSAPLALSSVGRVGSASMSWLGNLPNASTNIVVDTSPDGVTWTNVGSGASGSGSVSGSGYNGQPDPIIDSFTTITVAQYQNTTLPGGTAASWSYDTTNSRLLVSGGTNALYIYNQQSINDGYVMFDTEQADGIGLVIHYNNGQMYYLIIDDASATSTPNTVSLYKYTTTSTLLKSASISLARGTAIRFKIEYKQGVLTVWQEDTQLFTYTDTTSPIASGPCGLFSAGGSQQGGHFYQLFIQGYGDIVSSSSNLYHRVTLSTTDPTVSPTVTDLSLSVRDPSIADGALIPSTQYSVLNNDQPVASHLDDLATQSDHTWTINDLNQFVFQPRTGKPAPWVLKASNVLGVPKVSNIQQEYRNVQWMSGGSDTKTFTESFTGDGHKTSFNLKYPVDSILSITLDNVPVSVGPKGTSGNSYYFQQGDTSLAQDNSISPLTSADQLIVKYNGRVPITVKVPHQRAISKRKGREKKTSGKVEAKQALQQVATKKQAIKKAKQVVEYYTKDGRVLEFTTLRSGLAPGMLLTVFLLQHGFHDDQLLIESIDTTWQVVTENGVEVDTPFFTAKCTMGAVIGDWTRLFSHIHGKTK